MQVYNESQKQKSSNTSTRRCGYCGERGHVQSACPHAESDWQYWQRHEVPLKNPNCWAVNNGSNYGRWYSSPSEGGKWYVACKKAVEKIENARSRGATSTTRALPTCGFCGSVHHNRRNCPEMTKMLDRFVDANKDWRRRFYDRFVADMGLSVGAVVKCKVPAGWQKPPEEKIGVITGVNWEQLSMFCYASLDGNNWSARLHEKFRQQLLVEVAIEGKTQHLKFEVPNPRDPSRSSEALCDDDGIIADNFGYRYHSPTYISTVARSETPLDEEWVEQAHRKSLQFLVKKYSFERLHQWNVMRLLEMTEEMQKSS